MIANAKYAGFEALDPFFEVVQKGLSEFVDGDHYFDTIAEDAFFSSAPTFPVGRCQSEDSPT